MRAGLVSRIIAQILHQKYAHEENRVYIYRRHKNSSNLARKQIALFRLWTVYLITYSIAPLSTTIEHVGHVGVRTMLLPSVPADIMLWASDGIRRPGRTGWHAYSRSDEKFVPRGRRGKDPHVTNGHGGKCDTSPRRNANRVPRWREGGCIRHSNQCEE